MKLPIETENKMFGLYLYPLANKIREAQQDIAWTAQEIPVDKDRQDFKHRMTPVQYNVPIVTLQLFVEIEQRVGDVWDKIATWFPHSEIEGCCAEFARMEKAVHAFFYQKVSDELQIDPETTAKNQEVIGVLKSKLNLLKRITSRLDEDKLLSLATVTLIEQVLLFSNFAMLKSFQSNGNNLIKNTVTGVDFVVQDEQLHGDFAAYLFKTMQEENNKYKVYHTANLYDNILDVMHEIIKHEDAVIDYTFGDAEIINGITRDDLKTFNRHRANTSLAMLGFKEFFKIETNPIAEWFYRGAKSIKVHDFFAGITSQYRRSWKTEGFSRLPYMEINT